MSNLVILIIRFFKIKFYTFTRKSWVTPWQHSLCVLATWRWCRHLYSTRIQQFQIHILLNNFFSLLNTTRIFYQWVDIRTGIFFSIESFISMWLSFKTERRRKGWFVRREKINFLLTIYASYESLCRSSALTEVKSNICRARTRIKYSILSAVRKREPTRRGFKQL